LSGWLIRKANELRKELTELYGSQAFVEDGLAERKCHPLESAILNRSTAKCIELFTT